MSDLRNYLINNDTLRMDQTQGFFRVCQSKNYFEGYGQGSKKK